MTQQNKPKVHLIVLGKGLVGTAWLHAATEQKAKLAEFAEVEIIAVANSSRFLFSAQGLSALDISQFRQASVAGGLDQWLHQITECQLDNVVVLDMTASGVVADRYIEFAQRGWHVISANKIPLTKSTERHRFLTQTFRQNHCHWGINATVGAALPVQASINELLLAGDTLHAISGVFSGSLSYLLNQYDGQQSFTELVRQAKEAGVTEPDPRDDLSGTDVQRKLLILSRVAGYSLNLTDIDVEPLLPEALLEGDISEFWQNAEAIDSYMSERYQEAASQGKKLVYQAKARFINKVVEGKVGLVALEAGDPLTQLTGSDNVFTLTTDFYQTNPLVIRGPGAGARVTATAVNIDLNKFILQVVAAANSASDSQLHSI